MATNDLILDKTREFVKQKMQGEGTGHDWWHVARVVNTAMSIAKKEGGDLLVIELAALLHDIADWKFNDGDTTVGAKVAREWLLSIGTDNKAVEDVVYVVEHISFKGGTNAHVMKTIEGKIVQDADRLDAIGALGIARTFAFGGAAGRPIYDPTVKPKEYESFKSFKSSISNNHTINHFYEKLLLLKDKMNTRTGQELAKQRHEFMEKYLHQFYAEWEGSR